MLRAVMIILATLAFAAGQTKQAAPHAGETSSAWIAAAASVIAAIVSSAFAFIIARKTSSASRELAALNARLAYEYDARKRLYKEFEPLRFTLREASEAAYYRILNLAQSAKRGELEPQSGWTSHEGYYVRSTIYRLLVPSAIYRLMQRKLTLVDLTLDPGIAAAYELAKTLYITWTEDFVFAEMDPPLKYDPHHAVDSETASADLSKYIQQGIPSGYLDRSLDALLVVEKGEAPRLKSYGEFEADFRAENSDTRKANVVLLRAVLNFHPASRPVLWRILITQAAICRILFENAAQKQALTVDSIEAAQFDWRQTNDQAKSRLDDPFLIAKEYLRSRKRGR